MTDTAKPNRKHLGGFGSPRLSAAKRLEWTRKGGLNRTPKCKHWSRVEARAQGLRSYWRSLASGKVFGREIHPQASQILEDSPAYEGIAEEPETEQE